jgi:hypothetical protein
VDLQPFINKNIRYDEPKTLIEDIKKSKYLYEKG